MSTNKTITALREENRGLYAEIRRLEDRLANPHPGEPVAYRPIDPDGEKGIWLDATADGLGAARKYVESGVYSKIDLAYAAVDAWESDRLRKGTAFVQRLVDCAGTQQSVATGYLRDILDTLKGNTTPTAPIDSAELNFEFIHPDTQERRTVTVTRSEVADKLDYLLFEKLSAAVCRCEPVGETNAVDCWCDEVAENFELVKASALQEKSS